MLDYYKINIYSFTDNVMIKTHLLRCVYSAAFHMSMCFFWIVFFVFFHIELLCLNAGIKKLFPIFCAYAMFFSVIYITLYMAITDCLLNLCQYCLSFKRENDS